MALPHRFALLLSASALSRKLLESGLNMVAALVGSGKET
jgi:hypothetical protein